MFLQCDIEIDHTVSDIQKLFERFSAFYGYFPDIVSIARDDDGNSVFRYHFLIIRGFILFLFRKQHSSTALSLPALHLFFRSRARSSVCKPRQGFFWDSAFLLLSAILSEDLQESETRNCSRYAPFCMFSFIIRSYCSTNAASSILGGSNPHVFVSILHRRSNPVAFSASFRYNTAGDE